MRVSLDVHFFCVYNVVIGWGYFSWIFIWKMKIYYMGETMSRKENTYRIWPLAVPIAFESFFQMLFGFADTYVLGQYADEAVAAAG